LEKTYSPGFQVAATGLQFAKTKVRARIVTMTMTAMLTYMGKTTLRRLSSRMQVKPMAHLITVDEVKYKISQ
jgi:hypothetical protein